MSKICVLRAFLKVGIEVAESENQAINWCWHTMSNTFTHVAFPGVPKLAPQQLVGLFFNLVAVVR